MNTTAAVTTTRADELVTRDGETVIYRAVGNIELALARRGNRYFTIRGETVLETEAGATVVVSEILERR